MSCLCGDGLLLVPAMVGVLLARLATVGIALCFRRWLGTQAVCAGADRWPWFRRLTVLCIGRQCGDSPDPQHDKMT
ncbi:Uncharacterised protein [Klebsiella pneumoniae]|uniref:Uncharacterized protein n=1 Tax=Klebsiella pneumoniae TaxID=573 RepID=A0A378AGB1_KLEPN|nr:Uncharacterised protein [Klebsiella pneumoniae]